MRMDIDGRKALVFGGTSGIGWATVLRLRDLGATVVALSRHPEKAEAEAQEGITLRQADVQDFAALEQICRDEAPYQLLISTATGGSRAMGPFLDMDLAGYQGSFAKLFGYANVVKAGVPHLPDDGAVVLVSGSPARRPKPGQIALASVGAAVEQFARVLAAEIAPRRINVVSPGVIATPMFGNDSEQRQAMLQKAPADNLIKRPGTPDEVAQAILMAAQNDFLTGTTIDVDGGWLNA
jgi:NAD(P)-dependent dehydrogenase (short-subunit alcohol dehydrogenase family)